MRPVWLCVVAFLCGAQAVYRAQEGVVELTAANFEQTVSASDGVWLIELSNERNEEFIKAALSLKGIAHFGSVSAKDKELSKKLSLTAEQPYRVYGASKKAGDAFEGERTATAFAVAAVNAIRAVIKERLASGPAIPAASADSSPPQKGTDEPKKEKEKEKPKAKADTPKKQPADEDRVVKLTMQNFEELVIKSDDVWLVEFFAPWCGHCKNLAPAWKEAAGKAFGKGIHFGAVDATQESELAGKFSVQGYPTIKTFGPGKAGSTWAEMARAYEGGRGLIDLLKAAYGLKGQTMPAELLAGTDDDPNSAVVKLTDATFDKLVLQSADIWLVEFFAPWCGHCKSLAPEWRKAATELQGKVKIGAVDCDANPKLKQQFNIQGFPTIKVFPAFGKISPTDYAGGRSASNIVQFGLEMVADEAKPTQVSELVDTEVWERDCVGKSLCVFTVLPNILDSGLTARQALVEQLNKLSVAFRRQPFGFVWAEAGKQLELEQALSIGGAGYPALVVTNVKKSRFVNFQGGFNIDDVSEFLGRVLSGKQRTFAITQKLPAVRTTDAWDGTGPEVVREVENFDDLDGDGIKDEL